MALPYLPSGLGHVSTAGETPVEMATDVSAFTHVGKEGRPFIAKAEAEIA
jgi:hypothetical protein